MLRTPPGLRHALINLLNNAADASAQLRFAGGRRCWCRHAGRLAASCA